MVAFSFLGLCWLALQLVSWNRQNNAAAEASLEAGCVMVPTRFRTNNLVNPLALADNKPRFSYALALLNNSISQNEPVGTNHYQTAYRIQCTNALTGDLLWDSGKVSSPETLDIEYEGKPLTSLMRVTWNVQIWDEHGLTCDNDHNPSTSNANTTNTYFETGLLDEKSWGSAEWIARYGNLSPNASLCSLMAETEENKSPRFRAVVNLTQQQQQLKDVTHQQQQLKDVVHVRAYIAGLGYYQMYINGQRVGDSWFDTAWTTYSKRVLYAAHDVSNLILPLLKSNTAEMDDSSPAMSFAVGVELGNGEWNPLPMLFWGRRNIRYHLVHQQGHPSTRPMFRLHIVGLRADGSTVSLLTSTTSSSWRAGGSPTIFNNLYLGEKYDARLEASFEGWSEIGFTEDLLGQWGPPVKADASGLGKLQAQSVPPIRQQRTLTTTRLSIRDAENHNRIVLLDTGLNHAGTCRIQIQPKKAKFPGGNVIQFRYGESLTETGELNALTSVAGGIYKHNPDVPCQPDVAYQQDFLHFGSNPVDWTPSWSWHGFRYIEATLPQTLDPDDLSMECFTLRTDVEVISSFTSSDPWLSRLREIVQNTFESNLMGIQTGCPHRERFGYGGDALASGEAAMSIYDFSAFYRKRVLDYNDAQRVEPDTGELVGFTETSPFVGISDGSLGYGSGPIGWEMYQPEAQLWLYKYYGDMRTMKDSLTNTAAFIDFIDSRPSGVERGLGDWMPVYGTDVRYTGLIFQRMAYLDNANITEILGLPDSIVKAYRLKADRLARMLNERFHDGAGAFLVGTGNRTGNITQTGQSMALFTGIVSLEVQREAIHQLVKEIRSSSYIKGACHAEGFPSTCSKSKGGSGPHLTSGMFGIQPTLMALADGGWNDLAYDAIATKTYPSFRWMSENVFTNATTLWESYYYSDRLSQNHPMFGSSVVWLFQSVVGIQPYPSARGMDQVLVRPNPPRKLTHASASFETPRGVIKVSWERDSAQSFRLVASIPPNCRAVVHVPAMAPGTILHNGIPREGRWIPNGVGPSSERGAVAFGIGSGEHTFHCLNCNEDASY